MFSVRTRRVVIRIVFAVAGVAATVAVRAFLQPVLGTTSPLILFLLPVAAAAWYGGLVPGLVATLLGGTLGILLFTSRTPATEAHSMTFHWLSRGVPFLLVGGFISLMAAYLEAARALAAQKGHDLFDSEERQRQIFDSAKDFAIFTTDPAGVVTSWNAGAERLFGLSREAAVGRSSDLLWTPEDRAAGVPDAERAKAAAGRFAEDRRWHQRQDGGRFFANGTMRTLHDDGGAVTGFVKICRDDTAAESARAAAEQAGRAKDDFLATISHELRTPLSAIVGWTHLLEAGDADAAMRAEGLSVISRNARVQSQLIEDILDVSRITTGKLRLHPVATHLRQPVDAAVATVRTAADAKGVSVVVDFESDAPVHGDPDRLQQVFWNLLANAIKFTPPGGTVTVRQRRAGPDYVVSVTDTGQGIGREFLPFVFDRFRQADMSTTRRHGGLGLGLSIVRHLVELHGGRVSVESDGDDRGSTFTVTLPAGDLAGGRAAAVTPATEHAPDAGPSLGPLRVLVLDDEPDARRMLQATLARRGVQTVLAADVAAAMAILESDPAFDAVLSDIGLPGEDGYAFVRRLRAGEVARSARPLPAVALTAYTRPSDKAAALAAGFDDYLPKPVDPAELIALLDRLVPRR